MMMNDDYMITYYYFTYGSIRVMDHGFYVEFFTIQRRDDDVSRLSIKVDV